ncbi:Leucine-rich_repeat domain superfamily [Hexamita inflata]|uniref:Leucine-rich repeat domain superfamily n=1 Tax=Hexamita inflata TaxID=28002 RepID=A0AA86UWV8_9EUKA|nr:Leucine-rich repeat domain superfamily [Hexamita inflata]
MHLKNLSNLTHLHLDNNKIASLDQLVNEKNLKRLELLWIMNNPICDQSNFEAVLKEKCSQVKNLNKIVVKVADQNDEIRISKR